MAGDAAVHRDLLHDHGYFGEDLDQAFALLDSDTLRNCLSQTASPLVLLVTGPIYHGIVRHGLVRIDRASYRPIDVRMKRSETRAWVHVPGAGRAVAAVA